jgi:hypothetical protein
MNQIIKILNMKFHENKPVRVKFFLADGQTDMTRLVMDITVRLQLVSLSLTTVTSHKLPVHSCYVSTAQHIQVCSLPILHWITDFSNVRGKLR